MSTPSLPGRAAQVDDGRRGVCVHGLFAECVAAAPDAIALLSDSGSMTYVELDRRSNRIARALQARGVGPEICVGVCLDRSPELIAALLGILKAGGAYVPLDPTYPRDRLALMLRDTEARVVVTTSTLRSGLPANEAAWLLLDHEAQALAALDDGPVDSGASEETLAYVIFTSGSTGTPKGVEIPHRAIRRLVCSGGYAQLDASTTVLQTAPVAFDASTFEIWGPLLNGGRLAIYPDPLPTARGLGEAIRRHGVNTMWLTAALFNAVVDDDASQLRGLRELLIGGEALSVRHVRRALTELPGTRIINGYGPTETTTFATCFPITDLAPDARSVPIGFPIRDTQLHVLDEAMQPVPPGDEGELYIGGSGVGRGYRHRPELTQERFLPDPFAGGAARMYRTGDIVKLRPDGAVEYVGRRDNQVKIRGFRIELGEIETVLASHPAVKSCCVVVRNDTSAPRLVAYAVSKIDRTPAFAEVRAFLAERLPDYMVPAALVWMEALPVTANGKLDQRALPAPGNQRPELEQPYVAPGSPLEQRLCDLWTELLGLDRVGVLDNFFALGATSLLAIQAVGRLRRDHGLDVPVLKLFQFPTAASLAAELAPDREPKRAAQPRKRRSSGGGLDGVAVVGMAGRFPGAPSVDAFWKNLCDGVETISFFKDDELDPAVSDALRRDPSYVKARGVLEGVELFDAPFFGIQPKDAALMDPQQRLLLEVTWEAMEHAGYVPERIAGTVGVFAGKYNNSYYAQNVVTQPERIEEIGAFQTMVVNEKDYVATHLAHRLNLTGPALSIHTACSTSLVAVAQAFDSLRLGHCDFALAGGSSITVPVKSGYLYQEGAMLSPDGHCRPFDASAQGTTFSDGVAVVCLKRLSDALADGDTIYGVLRGAATNNDGAIKSSFTAPSVSGQAAVVERALEVAGVEARSISYVEGHGTATPLGDPIEVEALTQAFRASTDERGFCGLGSVKSNVGHLVIAAGATGLIKTALALKHRRIPPTLHFQKPNPRIDFAQSPFYVVDRLTEWPAPTQGPRLAGVSSFGVGGTNAHVIVEEPPVAASETSKRAEQLLVLSARSAPALEALSARLADHLEGTSDQALADIAHTLQSGRRAFAHRRVVAASSAVEAAQLLRSAAPARVGTGKAAGRPPGVAFLFPGQGSQYARMGAALYEREPVFRAEIDRGAAELVPLLGLDIRTLLFPPADAEAQAQAALRETRITQPALFLIEHALATLWASWGVQPSAMAGHSVGEFVCAVLAGVMRREDALRLVAARGQLMQALPPGSMLSVRLPAAEVQKLLPEGLDLAAENGPSLCVVAGPTTEVEAFEKKLTEQGVAARLLQTSHAFHSRMMESAIAPFAKLVEQVKLEAPRIPFVSTLSGTWITPEQARDPQYWARHLREGVRFAPAVRELLKQPGQVLLEVGPRATLTTLARQQVTDRASAHAYASLGDGTAGPSEILALLQTAGRLWTCGVELRWEALHDGERRRRVPLPTYPFERKRYWVEPAQLARASSTLPNTETPMSNNTPTLPARSQTLRRALKDLLEETSGNDLADSDTGATFMELGFDSLFLTQLALTVGKKFGVKVTFRELMEQFPSIDLLAQHLDKQLPAEAAPAPVAAPVAPPATNAPVNRVATAAPAAVPQLAVNMAAVNVAAAPAGSVQAVIAQQLQLMAQQLALLGGAAPVATSVAEAAPQPAPVAETPAPVATTTAAPATPAPEADAVPKTAEPYDPKKAFGAIARITLKGDELTPKQKARLDAFIRRYNARTQGSKRFTQENRAHMADPRVVTGFRPQVKELVYPIVVQRSAGSKVWDLDGNSYIDALNGFGCNLFGWQPEFVTRAVIEQLQTGHEIGPQTPLAAEAAKLVCEFTGFDRAAFCNTGSEAVMGCLRVARTVTGRSKIALFTGSYHGIFDEVIVRGTKKLRSFPAAPGIMGNTSENVLVLDYGTPESLEILRQNANELAAVLIEPIQSRRPDFQPREFLHELRKITEKSGTVFIFDEVITGFRMGPGGAQEFYGIKADMASYGKVVGGGLPVGVIAGKREYMDALDGGHWQYGDASLPTVGVTYFAGTFVRHPLALAAVKAVLLHLKEAGPALQQRVAAQTTALANELNAFFEQVEAPLKIKHFSSLWKTFYTAEQPMGDLLFYMLRDRGIHIYDGFPCFFTTAHTEADAAQIVKAFKESVLEMQESGFFPEPTKTKPQAVVDANTPPVPGARLGRDPQGNPAWYVPNPEAPGKYMKLSDA